MMDTRGAHSALVSRRRRKWRIALVLPLAAPAAVDCALKDGSVYPATEDAAPEPLHDGPNVDVAGDAAAPGQIDGTRNDEYEAAESSADTVLEPGSEPSGPDAADAGVSDRAIAQDESSLGQDDAPFGPNDGPFGPNDGPFGETDGPTPVVLASGQTGAWDLTTDGVFVYWTLWANPGAVLKVPVGGGAPVTLATNQTIPICIATDGTSVYWTTFSNPGNVMRVSADGGAPTVLASGQAPNGIAVDQTAVYWAEGVSDGGLMKLPRDGGPPVALAHGLPGAVAIDQSNLYWTDTNAIMRVPLAGGTTATVAPVQTPFWVISDALNVYWSEYIASGSITGAAKDGGAITTIATGQSWPTVIASDGVRMYWTDSTNGRVLAAPLTGGVVPTVVAGGQNGPHGVAVDGLNVYWTNNGDGTVMKIAK